MITILEKKDFSDIIHLMVFHAPAIAKKAEPGQFIIVILGEKGERFPLTIADFDRDKGTISIVFQEMGKSTRKFGRMKVGDKIFGILGPQGTPTKIENFGKTVVIGGGIGVAPVYPLARKLRQSGNHVTSIIGFRSKQHIFWEEKMNAVVDKALIATNDGSYGKKGFVTDILKEMMDNNEKIDRVFAIGPAIMMRAVAELTRNAKIPTIVSLNAIMVCGMGMCGACRVTIDEKTRFTCMDGPDFDGHLVDFDEFFKRLNSYKNEEKLSLNKWNEED